MEEDIKFAYGIKLTCEDLCEEILKKNRIWFRQIIHYCGPTSINIQIHEELSKSNYTNWFISQEKKSKRFFIEKQLAE